MKNKSGLLLFAVLALVQLAIPFQMIFHQEDILNNGKLWKFKTAPVDPNDPFRGKYIFLNFDQNRFQIKNKDTWHSGQTIYANLVADEKGFAKVKSISSTPPDNTDYMTMKVNYIADYEPPKIIIWLDFPFDRFYVNENKAAEAERIYVESVATEANKKEAYALIALKDGEGVIKDVLIDNISIKVLAAKE